MDDDRWTKSDRDYIELSTMVYIDRQQEAKAVIEVQQVVDGEEQLREARAILDADVREGKRTQEEAELLYREYVTSVYGPQSTEFRKRNKRTAYKERLVRMTHTINRAELDAIIPPIIREANIHTRHVAGEEKHKAERHERVGLFVTDLRRMIGYKTELGMTVLRSLVLCLCNKAVWHDAGVLETNFSFPAHGTSGMEPDDLRRWAKAAEIIVDENEYAMVDRLLAEVKEDTDGIRLLLQRADTVGGRAERAADDLVEFMTQTAAS